MAIQIGEKPSPTFNEPLALLSDCHRRIERFLAGLILVTKQAQGGDLNEQQREALKTSLRYFREGAPKHTQDEENSLFPRMRACNRTEVQCALDKLQELEADHRVAEKGHHLVDQIGERWLKDSTLSPADTAALVIELQALHAIYQRHIVIEDQEVFPLAEQVLDAQQLQAVGEEMAGRRRTQK
jgi:hemerythrin-like domain-containing protein